MDIKFMQYKNSSIFLFFAMIFFVVELTSSPIIQPGAPGIESVEINKATAIEIADTSYIEQDVLFL